MHIALLLLATLTAQERAVFVQKVYQEALAAHQLGAPINPAVVAAQAALESRFGDSVLARKYNNIFGIHAGRGWRGKTVTFKDVVHLPNGEVVVRYYSFRVYDSIQDCIADYIRIVSQTKYYTYAAQHHDDIDLYLSGLLPSKNKPGWATDPMYKAKIKRIIQQYGLL